MNVSVNGAEHDLPADATVADAVHAAGVAEGERGVAVALDGVVVPRATWRLTVLREGAAVEVLRATAGG